MHIIFITLLREHLVSQPPLFFGGIRVAHLLSILCCVVCFVCHRLVTCVLNVAYVSGLSIPACPFGFLDRLFYVLIIMDMWIVLCIFNAMCWSFGGGNRTTDVHRENRQPATDKL
jgi:hypothetical protein